MKKKVLISLLLLFSVFQFASALPPRFSKDLVKLTEWYVGSYENVAQARRDTSVQKAFAHIVPIFENRITDAIWLYEEITDDKKQVISQRIFRFADVNANQWEAVIYELEGMERYAGEWQNPDPFGELDPEIDLVGLADCAIIFNKKGDTKYTGSTIRKSCKYGKLNAFYVTSEIEVYENKIVRADRGFEHDHTLMWGPAADQKGFQFKKIDQKAVDAKERAKAQKEAQRAKKRADALAKKEAAKEKRGK